MNEAVKTVAPGAECWGAFDRVESCTPVGSPSCDAKPLAWDPEYCYFKGDRVIASDENIYEATGRNTCNYPEYSTGFWNKELDCTPLNEPTTCGDCE